MSYAAGVDVGSTQTKAVVIDEDRAIVGRSLIDTGANVIAAAEKAFQIALGAADVMEEEVDFVIGTGYGRYNLCVCEPHLWSDRRGRGNCPQSSPSEPTYVAEAVVSLCRNLAGVMGTDPSVCRECKRGE